MFSQLHYSQMAGWEGLFISPTKKVAVGDETHFSATDRTLITSWPDTSNRPDRWSAHVDWMQCESSHYRSDASGRDVAALEPLWTRSDAAVPASGRSSVSVRSVLNVLPRWWTVSSSRPVTFSPQRPVAVADAFSCRATDRTRPVPIRAAKGHLCEARFFAILRPAYFLSSCLDFAWSLGSFLCS